MSDKPEADDEPFTTNDFHTVVHKQIVSAVGDILAGTKLDWKQFAPFLGAARDLARADFAEANVRLHALHDMDGALAEAEEAFLGISVHDRDDGGAWLSDTYWVSDIAIQDDDPAQARAVVQALERSIAKINTWIAEKEKGDASEPAPPR